MFQKWLKELKACKLFSNIEPDELETMLLCFNPIVRDYKKNESISCEGEELNGIGVVLGGEVAVVKENISGDRMIIDVLKPSEIFGEIVAFNGQGKWPATVIAQCDSTVMFIPAEKIAGECSNVCRSHRNLIVNMLKILSEKAMQLNRKVDYLSIKNIRSKISVYLLEQYKKEGKPMFLMDLKRSDLADFLNISRPSLSRELCKMRDEGILEFYRESVRILDIDTLKSCAEY